MAHLTAEFAQVWNLLGIAYPNFSKDAGPEQMLDTGRLYWELLRDIPIEQLKAAVLRHIASSKWFPSVAELRESAITVIDAPAQTALEAWGEVTDAMHDSAYYIYVDHCRVPQFANPVTNQLVASMGWRELCQSDNPIADRARFTEAYNVLVQRQRNEVSLPQLLRAGAQRQAMLDAARQPQPELPANGNGAHASKGLVPLAQIVNR